MPVSKQALFAYEVQTLDLTSTTRRRTLQEIYTRTVSKHKKPQMKGQVMDE